jgi:CheY-like chemotaxis protein
MNKIEKPAFDGEVLLCEDNKMNRDIICDHLARVGLKTVVAENGLEGVKAFRNRIQNNDKPFDLVFMDIQMPVMDGLEAGGEINKMNAGMPIIAMTANATPADREEYAAHGMPDCVNKPFTSQELWRCLLKYLTPVNAGGVAANAAADAVDKPAAENLPVEFDEEFQRRMIHNFISENKNRYGEIIDAIKSGKVILANRLAHSLKSNAGHLGKTELQKAAQNVENLLRDENSLAIPGHRSVLRDELNTLKAELDPVLEEFAPFEAERSPGGEVSPCVNVGAAVFQAEEKLVLINKLELLLEPGNPECLSLVDSLRAMPESEELIAQMEDFNFDEALEILGKLKQKWR